MNYQEEGAILNREIPKVIHYCWFGGNPLPELAKKCIQSWKKFCPDYEIKEWNESNFNLTCCDYVKEAYEAKKWAFVSDYARYWILYNEGGLYFDTDVEIINSIEDIVEKGPFLGRENEYVSPGLAMAAYPKMEFYKKMLEFYEQRHFLKKDGDVDTTTIVMFTTSELRKKGYMAKDEVEFVDGIYIYPTDYFCPIDFLTGRKTFTSNTRTIHHYAESWLSETEKKINKIGRMYLKYGKVGRVLERITTLPLRVWNKVQKKGLKNTIKFAAQKLCKARQ